MRRKYDCINLCVCGVCGHLIFMHAHAYYVLGRPAGRHGLICLAAQCIHESHSTHTALSVALLAQYLHPPLACMFGPVYCLYIKQVLLGGSLSFSFLFLTKKSYSAASICRSAVMGMAVVDYYTYAVMHWATVHSASVVRQSRHNV